jgi:hypothetical protein
MASSCSADNDLNQSNAKRSQTNSAAVKRMGKWTECGATGWGADKPFSNISESVIAKNVTQTVCFIKIYFSHKNNSNRIELYFCD